ncbi:MAG: SusC/RagA family TonB-linked outer membrane protein [Gemmatimonadales bacterium]
MSRKSAGVLAALLLLGGRPALAQRGTVGGIVKEQVDNTPIAGAVVQLGGTNRRGITNRDGRYVITQVAAGTYRIRVSAIGYAATSSTVTVDENAPATADFAMARSVMTLEQISVTPVGEQTQREAGAPPTMVNTVDSLTRNQTVSNFGDLLSGRVAGVSVMQSGGSVGTGTRVLIRGQSSISLSNAPAYYVDGVRVESSDASLSVGTGGQTRSRIDDIDPNDIASIEIVKGPSAGTLYGTQAANGVIRITTKHGLAGRAQWTAYSEVGVLNDQNHYPDNFYSWGHSLATGAIRQCTLVSATLASGPTCAIDSLTSFNVLQNPTTTPIGPGYKGQAGIQVSGGSDQVQYYLSGDYNEILGTLRLSDAEYARLTSAYAAAPDYTVYRPNQLHAVNVRSNIHAVASPTLDFTGTLGLVQSSTYLPQNDNNVTGLLPSGLFGTGYATSPTIYGFFLPGDVSQIQTRQDIDRLTGTVSVNWLPSTWFTGRATAGLDYTGRTDFQSQLRGQGPNFSNFRQGRITDNRFSIYHYTADVSGTAQFALNSDWHSKTSVGMQYLHDNLFAVLANATNLPPGGQSVTAGATRSSSEQTTAAVTLGEYLEQVFGFRNRVFITGGLRYDRNSAFGTQSRTASYPNIQASWVLSEEPFFPRSNFISNLRLRAAYGATGNQPGTTAALQFFTAQTASVPTVSGGGAGTDQPAIVLTSFGNSSLKPERSAELELGFDAGVLHDGLRVEFTYYNKQTHDALVSVPLPPGNGVATNRFVNLGSTQNHGIEIGFDFLKRVSSSVTVDGNLAISRNINKLLSLGAGIPTIKNNNNVQWDTIGFPLFGWWDRPIKSFKDANGNGIIEPNELVMDSFPRYLGSSIPQTNITFNGGVTILHGRLRIGGQLDYRGDYLVYNFTERFRCAGAGFNCAGINNPKDSPFDQARAVAATVATPFNPTAGGGPTSQAGYLEDGSFLKLREASITYYAPESWARVMHAQRLQFTLTGRNLWRHTNYSGLDPEVNGNGTNDLVDDFLTAPPIRTVALRVTVGF